MKLPSSSLKEGLNRLGAERLLDLWGYVRSWRTRDRLVVLESDDWGAVRMPGQNAFNSMVGKGLGIENSRFDYFDCLESGEDLGMLFEVLDESRGASGSPAVMTMNMVMGNPDFEAIREDQFQNFHHEGFFTSYQRYYGESLESLWQSAIQAGLIKPQFHAREHLNSALWLHDLNLGREETRFAFEHGFYGQSAGTSSRYQKTYLAAYWAEGPQELIHVGSVLADGLNQFESTFGFPSKTFIGCNYVWPTEIESALHEQGVELLQGQRGHLIPQLQLGGRLSIRRRYAGQSSSAGQFYSVRNVRFEPYEDPTVDWVDRAVSEIARAFRFRCPAVISSHRINYTSGMCQKHRNQNVALLRDLLRQIRRLWPDVLFISSDQLLDHIQAPA